MPGVIKINPDVFKDTRDAMAVAWNEGLRLFMEDVGFEPAFDITPEQEKFFEGTAYAGGEGTAAERGGDVAVSAAAWDKSIREDVSGRLLTAADGTQIRAEELMEGPSTVAGLLRAAVTPGSDITFKSIGEGLADYAKATTRNVRVALGEYKESSAVREAVSDVSRAAINRMARRVTGSPNTVLLKGPLRTETDFSPEELDFMRDQARDALPEGANKGSVTYGNGYPGYRNSNRIGNGADPAANIYNRLGQYLLAVDEKGEVTATDTYDFNAGDRPVTLMQVLNAPGDGLIRALASRDSEPDSGKARFKVKLGNLSDIQKRPPRNKPLF